MLKLLLGIAVEVAVAICIAGLLLALAVPLLNRGDLATVGDTTSTIVITGVMIAALAIALFRRGSALRRYSKR